MNWLKSIVSGAGSFFGGLPWASIGIIAAIASGALYGVHVVKANVVLADQLKQVEADTRKQHSDDLAALAALKAQDAKDMQTVVQEKNQAAQRAVAVTQQLEAIKNAPKSDDGIVAPVLDRALLGLRGIPAGTAKH